MSQNVLKCNDGSSEVNLFGPLHSISSFCANLCDLSNHVTQAGRNLGIKFDANLCFDNHVKISIIRSFFPYFFFADRQRFDMLLSTLGALNFGISRASLHHLQLEQNAAARRSTLLLCLSPSQLLH